MKKGIHLKSISKETRLFLRRDRVTWIRVFFPSISNSKVKMCWRWILVKKKRLSKPIIKLFFVVVKCFILEKFVSLSWIPVKTFQGGLLPKVLKLGFFYFNSCHGQIDVFYAIDWIISSLTKNNQHLMLYLTGRLYWQLLYNIKWWWKK